MADSRYRTKYYRGNPSGGNLPSGDGDEWQEDDGGQAGFGGGRGGGRGGQRNDQESGGGNSYRPRSNYSDRASGDAVTMVVASSDVGRIIGKGGKTIRELEENSRARIKILEGQGDRTIEISGSEDAKATAQDLINKILEANQNRGGGGGGGGFGFRDSGSSGNYRGNGRGSYGDGGDRRSARGDDLTINVASSDIGRIIGKGGMKIRELQDSSGARIKILDDTGSGDRQVLISGSDESKALAQELIKELTDASQNRGSRYDGANAGFAGNDDNNFGVDLQRPAITTTKIDWGLAIAECTAYQSERWSKAPEMLKNFYFEDPQIAAMTPVEANKFRKDYFNISVSWLDGSESKQIPNPVHTFEQAFAHYPEVLRLLESQGFDKPSPIQSQSWPVLLQGLDLIGIAQTGTGKTLAFLLPAFIHIDLQPVARDKRGGPNVLIMAPTRELAQQIEKEANKFHYRGIKSVCVYGGGSRREQVDIVAKGVQIVIATPGRLNDLVMAGVIDVASVTYLVLDEADRMLDMGFEPQIKKILLDVRPDRQSVMTSATWPPDVRRMANLYMKNPVQVYVGTLDLAAASTVTQVIEFIPSDIKRDRLYEFIENMEEDDKVIVFVGKKTMADDLSSEFAIKGVNCQCIHGDREQCDREQALEDMKTGDVRILVATDVASRGLDIKDITHILNYDFPRNIEEYVHRVGRTGRAGRTGKSITFMTREDWRHAQELIDILEKGDQEIPQELRDMAGRYSVWKEKKDAEKASERPSGNRTGGYGGGQNHHGSGSFGGRRGGGREYSQLW